MSSSIRFVLTPTLHPTWTEHAAQLGHAPAQTGLSVRTEQVTGSARPSSFLQKAGFPATWENGGLCVEVGVMVGSRAQR